MGLRSRQRRMQGIAHEDSFDVETNKHRTQSLDEHLQASRRDVDDRNQEWKNSIAMMGLLFIMYEAALYYQTLVIAHHASPNVPLGLVLKFLAVGSLVATRYYVKTGQSMFVSASVVATIVYVAVWAASYWVLGIKFSMLQVSPVPIAYFAVSHAALAMIGGTTKAEAARAQQLEKMHSK